MTKTYYKDDVTDWISNIIKAKSNSNSESSTATVMELNCINLGSKEKQNIEPSLKFVAHGYQVDGAKEHQIKLKIGTNQLVKHFAVSNNNFELDDATDVIEFIYKNRKQNMIVYFDTNNYAVFELSGLDRLAPDLMECVAL